MIIPEPDSDVLKIGDVKGYSHFRKEVLKNQSMGRTSGNALVTDYE